MKNTDIIKKFDNITAEIKANINNYDPQLLKKLADEIVKKLPNCYKVDEDILSFLHDRKNFRNMNELKKFVKQLTGSTCSKKRRKDLELEGAQLLANKGLTLGQIQAKKPPKPKAPPKKKKPKEVIPDRSQTWLRMSEEELRKEFTKYSKVSDLKKAANSLLKSPDKRLRSRKKVEDRIIERISNRKALFQLGK
ncbi:MAG: hypothetical protein ACFFC7_34130 [Candidatus Hermodarchaeota archaeon]